MSNNVVEVLRGVVGELKEIAKSETIIGEPVTVGDKTVIPVVKISFGFGAGGGEGAMDERKTGFGGGGGGGAKIEPAAFIVWDAEGVRVLPAGKGKWDTIIDAIPAIAKKISKVKDSFVKDGKGKGSGDDVDLDDILGDDEK
ncbi:sporulation protein [bacterium]|nr:sporulation protein [bacterium]